MTSLLLRRFTPARMARALAVLCLGQLLALAGCTPNSEAPPPPRAVTPKPIADLPADMPSDEKPSDEKPSDEKPAVAGETTGETPPSPPAATQPVPDKSALAQSAPTQSAGSPKSAGDKASPVLAGDQTDSKQRLGKDKKFDPIEVNGTFFKDWPKPKLALVITGRQDGYLEPCGCAGLENQKGGLSRRHSLLKQLAADGWPLAPLDVGSLVRRFGKQAELQFAISADALRAMHYAAVGFGASDLRLSAGEVAAAVTGAQPDQNIFVSANVDLFGLTPRVRIVEAGGMKLGITSVLGDEFREQVNNTELQVQPAAAALAQVLPQLDGCDLKILLANATLEESEALAKKFPQFDVVVTGGGPDEPPSEAKKIEGSKAQFIEVGHKGMYAVVLGFYDDPQQSVRYQRVALDSRFPTSPEMVNLMTAYQSQLQALGWSGLGLRPASHPQSKPGDELAGRFLGAASCRECHTAAWDVWSKSKHAHATDTLVKLHPPRQFDAECVSCHVTGWNAQEFFPYKSGFESLEKTPQLAGNSCENCHGPGAAHVAAEKGADKALQDQWRALLHQDKAQADDQSCRKCHDLDNSPEFNFEKYWAEIAH